MGHTKELLEQDWEYEWTRDYMYKMELQRMQEQEYLGRQPAQIQVIDLRKEKHETELNVLPF